jgi:hypothetical protein
MFHTLWFGSETKQNVEHVQKPSDKAKDGPFYEAKRKSKGWTIL